MASLTEYLERAPLSRFHYTLLVILSLSYALTAMNVMLIGAVLPSIKGEWGLDDVSSGLLLSAGYVGMAIGAVSSGAIADRVGRKRTLILMLATMSIFTAACRFAGDFYAMSFLRLLAGIGLGGCLPIPGVYMSEYPPAKYRGRFVGLVETAWVYGALLSLAFPYFLIPRYGWRDTFLIALIPLALIPFVALKIPESMRYLEGKGKLEEAKEIVKGLGLLKEGEKITLEIKKAKYKLTDLFSKQFLKRTVVLWVTWAVLVYTYHGIFIWLPTIYYGMGFTITKSLEWTLIVTLAQVPGYYSATFLLDRIGRKPVTALYLAAAGIGCILLGLSQSIELVFVWSLVISFFNLGAWSGLYTYTPELYPTEIRGFGSGVAASVGRVAGILAPTITGYLMSTGGLLYPFAAFSIAHLSATLTIFLIGIETKGFKLEEISG